MGLDRRLVGAALSRSRGSFRHVFGMRSVKEEAGAGYRGTAKYSNRRSRYKRLLKYLNEPVDRSLPGTSSPLLARFSIKC